MQKSYECELATHIGPESCGAARKGGVEALTGVRAGRVFSRESTFLRDADAVGESGRLHPVHRDREVQRSPARSETPTYGSTSRGNREIPGSPRAAVALGRIGKSKDVLWSAKTPVNSFTAPCNAVRRKHRQKIVDDQAAIPSS